MRISFKGPSYGLDILRELLSPWDVSITGEGFAEIAIVYVKLPETGKAVIIPSNSPSFSRFMREIKSEFRKKPGKRIGVEINSKTCLGITPSYLYQYEQFMEQGCKSQPIAEKAFVYEAKSNRIYLKIDIIDEFKNILNRALNARSSGTYSLLTRMPLPYSIAPESLKNLFMKNRNKEHTNLSFCDRFSLDALRFILVEAIEKLSGRRLPRKPWASGSYVCILTHDVESRQGLDESIGIKKIEEKYDFPSAWYIPSNRYKLDHEKVRDLANHGEIGSHDTKHDGKLAYLPKEKLVARMLEARASLQKITGQSVSGFRAPLLQHSNSIIEAVKETGFVYDSSFPTWEPKHPFTLKSHGIFTAFPFSINGLIEIPITLPQDHQMLTVTGLTCRETLLEWFEMISLIKDMGGMCSFLVHPDYKLANLKFCYYEELINFISSDDQAYVTLPHNLCEAKMKEDVL